MPVRVFIDARDQRTRDRLMADLASTGWIVVDRRDRADVVLSEPSPSTVIDTASATAGDTARLSGDGASDAPVEALTTRELDVLVLLAEGLGNREIAAQLGITEHTVKFHLSAIFGKLGATTRTEAVRRALKLGWVGL